jgi:hypothetical protein
MKLPSTMKLFGDRHINICAAQNENSRHSTDLGLDAGRPDTELETRVDDILYIFYLELKKLNGKLLPSQIKWNENFDKYRVSKNAKRDVAYGFEQAKEKILAWAESLAVL